LSPDSHHVLVIFFFLAQLRDNFTYFVLGVFEQRSREKGDWEFPETILRGGNKCPDIKRRVVTVQGLLLTPTGMVDQERHVPTA